MYQSMYNGDNSYKKTLKNRIFAPQIKKQLTADG